MAVLRWDPVRELTDLERSIHQLVDGRFDARVAVFPVDVYETASEVVVRADLPGVKPDNIQVQHHDGQLYIRATRAPEAPKDAAWLLRQTPEGEMVRTLSLGAPVELDDVQATYEAGVLELRLPKAEQARPKQIPVRVGAGRRPRAIETRAAEPAERNGGA
jgi:HSP20 family protein